MEVQSMEKFENGQRIIVNFPDVYLGSGRAKGGVRGTVVRKRKKDDNAWVLMDEVPEETVFPSGDPRHNSILLSPRQCSPVAQDEKEMP
jgi:hypothetical protein